MNYQLIDRIENKRYEIEVEGFSPRIEYIKTADKIFLTHTEVPIELKGRGIGSALIELVLEDIEKQGQKLMPLCPFVAGYIKKKPEWKRILALGVHVD